MTEGIRRQVLSGMWWKCRDGVSDGLRFNGVFCSIVELQAAINRFVSEANDNLKPFVWTADPDKIIAAVKRGHQALDSIR